MALVKLVQCTLEQMMKIRNAFKMSVKKRNIDLMMEDAAYVPYSVYQIQRKLAVRYLAVQKMSSLDSIKSVSLAQIILGQQQVR